MMTCRIVPAHGLGYGAIPMRWETHCHTVYSNRRKRRFDALNTPKEMIEAAISRGLRGLVITDHDSVKGGLVGQRLARNYPEFIVIPGIEVTSAAGHILAIGVRDNIPKGLQVAETIEEIHSAGGIAVASHPFSKKARSVKDQCVLADAIEVFNANNTPKANSMAMQLAGTNSKPKSAGSDAHWTRVIGNAGLVCDDPLEDLLRGRARVFGTYTTLLERRTFQAKQILSSLAGRPIA